MKHSDLIRVASIFVRPRIISFFGKAADYAWWEKQSRRLGSIGSGSFAARGFSLMHPECMRIGSDFRAAERLLLQAWPEYGGKPTGLAKDEEPHLVIGNGVHISQDCQISCADEVVIGDGCLFGGGVFITDNLHGSGSLEELDSPPYERMLSSKGPVNIGKNVWLGRNVCVMPGVTIGDGAIVGANAVVTHDIPAYSVAAGVPARVIKQVKCE